MTKPHHILNDTPLVDDPKRTPSTLSQTLLYPKPSLTSSLLHIPKELSRVTLVLSDPKQPSNTLMGPHRSQLTPKVERPLRDDPK